MSSRRGFTLIEMLLALVIGSVIGLALTKLITSQTRFFTTQQAIRDARSASRSALNVMLSDLRMVEASGGVVSATSTDLTVRVPYAFGIVCASTAAAMTVSLVPVDSATLANAGLSGYAWRDTTTGAYNYVDGAVRAAGVVATCTGASITTLTGGTVALLTPGPTAPAVAIVGTPIFLYQRVRYYFGNSSAITGRTGLFRQVVATNNTDELVHPCNPAQPSGFTC